jgi:Glycosyl hydrolase family 79 C-terminal beta domain
MIPASGSGASRGRWRWTLAAVLAVVLAFTIAVAASAASELFESPTASGAGATRRSHRALSAARVQVTVPAQAAMNAVPPSFLGLSTEYWSLPQWASQMPLLERVISLLHVPGGGPLILRVGGDSADHSFWNPNPSRLPRWAFTIQPRLVDQTRRLVRGLGVRLIIDLNLITDSPAQATQWARAAEAALPRASIIGFEIGNEPDIYTRHAWLAITAGRQYLGRALPSALTAADYVRDFRAYASALAQVAPGSVLAGPALARPTRDAGWVRALIAGDRRSLGMVTVHRYPLSGCSRHPSSNAYPTVGRLLSPELAQGMATALRPVVDAAHDAGLPLRMTELNSINCGGREGVSNTFATALWASDALFALVHAGVDGVNLHVRADTINAPFALTGGGLDARPLLYGLILFRHALGPQARLLVPGIHARRSLNLAAYAVRTGRHTLHVVLIDKGARSLRVALRLPATSPATLQRLTAPSAAARSGVTFAGRRLDRQGDWQGPAVHQLVSRRSGVYTVDVRHASAALVTVPVDPGALGAPPAAATGGRPPRAAGRAARGARSPQS